MEQLTRDPLYLIGLYVDIKDVVHLSATCKRLYNIFGDELSNKRFWRWKGYYLGIMPLYTMVCNARSRCIMWAVSSIKNSTVQPYVEKDAIKEVYQSQTPYANYTEFYEDIRTMVTPEYRQSYLEGDEIVIVPTLFMETHIHLHQEKFGLSKSTVHVDDVKEQQTKLLQNNTSDQMFEDDDGVATYNEHWRRDEQALLAMIMDDKHVYSKESYEDSLDNTLIVNANSFDGLSKPDPSSQNHQVTTLYHKPRLFKETMPQWLKMNTIDLQTYHQTKNLQPPDKHGYSEGSTQLDAEDRADHRLFAIMSEVFVDSLNDGPDF